MVAIGGWGDTESFEVAARTESSRKLFARNVGRMVVETGADGKALNKQARQVDAGRLTPYQASTSIGNTQGQHEPFP